MSVFVDSDEEIAEFYSVAPPQTEKACASQ